MELEYSITLMVLFILLAITYLILTLFILTRVKDILKDNKNYVGKLFYIFKTLLCLSRLITSLIIILQFYNILF